MKDEYVFPQDRRTFHDADEGPYNIREGGLTKRELFAAMLLLHPGVDGYHHAITLADGLLKVLAEGPE